ncbi:hypothetical protein LINGRAHAP2_LOCUS31716 [Linum grandiflorum]
MIRNVCSYAVMADVMSGMGHGGDGGGNDDDDHRRRAAEKDVTDWYTCTIYEWNSSQEKWKVREWMMVGQDGRRIFLELNSQGVPCKQGGKYCDRCWDVGKKWREHGGKIWTDIKRDEKTLEEYIASKPNLDSDDRDWERFVKYRMRTKVGKLSETNKTNKNYAWKIVIALINI